MRRLAILLVPVLFMMFSIAAWAEQKNAADLTIVTGEHWVPASLEQKRAYLFGVGNVLEIEQAMAGKQYESMRGRSLVPVLLEGLSGTSIADMVILIDKYYADHPDQMNRPVLEVMYVEMALPRVRS